MKARFALFLLIPLLSGCLAGPRSDPGDEPPPIEWGLGIDTTGGQLQVASFAEPAEDVLRLRDFLAHTTDDLFAACGSNGRSYVDGWLPGEYYLPALEDIPYACNEGQAAEARRLAQRMIANDSVESDLHRLRADAYQSVRESRALLEALPERGAIVDVEVLAVLFGEQRFIEGALESSKQFQQSFNESPELINLQAAVLNVINPQRTAQLSIPWIVDHYPWSSGRCIADMAAIEGRLRALIAEFGQTPRPERGIDYQGRAWDSFQKDRARYNLTLEQHRLPLELSHIAFLSWELASMKVEPPLPTHEEAQFLFDSYRNQTRTLFTDRLLHSYLRAGLEDYQGPLWEEVGLGAATRAKAVFSLDWPIEEVRCSG